MKLSEAILKIEFETRQDGDKKSYLPFSGCLIKAFPLLSNMDARHAAFPLAFCCPLFCGIPTDGAAAIVEAFIPGELPKMAGVFFISDLIDSLHYGKGKSREDIATLIDSVEKAFTERGLDLMGHRQ